MDAVVEQPVLPAEVANALLDPQTYADLDRLSSLYAWLRCNMPLGIARSRNFDPFWVVTRHADIVEVSKNNKAFHNGDRATILTDRYTDLLVRYLRDGSPHLARTLAHMDDPDHRKYRTLTSNWFMASNLARREEAIRSIARGFIDRMFERGDECDFVADVAVHYPLHVIMQILGVPIEDEPLMLRLTKQVFGNLDEDLNREGKVVTTAEQGLKGLQGAVDEFFRYFDVITQDRRRQPRDDLATVIAQGMVDDAPIGSFEAMSYYSLVSTAGHDTVSASTAGAMLGLATHPDAFAQVIADPALIPNLAEEAIRWTSPVRHFMRSATEDYTLAGCDIRKGDWLMLCYLSGNQDEAVFDDPRAFRVDRAANRHVAFGFGGHMCLGQHLARMEMRVFFEELLPRLKGVELAGEPTHTKAVFVGGLKSLPLRLRPA